ncbi:MAG: DedA family protein [Candidatus Dormibacteria bacterium]
MSHFVLQLVGSGGLVAIFVLMALESAGIPISSEIVVPLGGALASGALVGQTHLDFIGVVAASSIGNLAGSMVAYLLVRRYGEGLMLGPGRKIGLSAGHMRLAERFFDRFGLFAVFLGRLLPVVRTYISFPAGLSKKVQPIPFAVATTLGAIPWNFALAYAGLKLGDHYHDVEKTLGKLTIPIALLVLLALVALYVAGKRMKVEERILGEDVPGAEARP